MDALPPTVIQPGPRKLSVSLEPQAKAQQGDSSMSEENVASIINSIGRLKTTVITLFVALILGAFSIGAWQAMLMFRLSSLETWRAERQKPIDEYYKSQKEVESKLAVLTQRSDEAEKWRDRMEQKIDLLLRRGAGN